MKTFRFTAALLAVLLVAGPAAGQIVIRFGGGKKADSSKGMAALLAAQIKEVKKRFDTNRRALRPVRSAGGEAYPSQEVAGLIARTGEDLDQAIQRVGDPGLDALRAWAAEELGRIQAELAAPAGKTAASPSGLFAPRAVAVIAGFRVLTAAAPREETVPAETANRLLDQLGEVVSRIFFLAERDDLEVDLWVGSTPAPPGTFSFLPQGRIKGTTAPLKSFPINSKRKGVLRGLYSYKAIFGNGPVTQLIQYPTPAGAPEARPGDRLDLVKESSFFCCRFNDQYCHHVADKKQCR